MSIRLFNGYRGQYTTIRWIRWLVDVPQLFLHRVPNQPSRSSDKSLTSAFVWQISASFCGKADALVIRSESLFIVASMSVARTSFRVSTIMAPDFPSPWTRCGFSISICVRWRIWLLSNLSWSRSACIPDIWACSLSRRFWSLIWAFRSFLYLILYGVRRM